MVGPGCACGILRRHRATRPPSPRSRSGGLHVGVAVLLPCLRCAVGAGMLLAVACMRAPPASGPSGLCAEKANFVQRQDGTRSSALQPRSPRGLGACSLPVFSPLPHPPASALLSTRGCLLPCCTGRPAWRTCCIDGGPPLTAPWDRAQQSRAPRPHSHLHTSPHHPRAHRLAVGVVCGPVHMGHCCLWGCVRACPLAPSAPSWQPLQLLVVAATASVRAWRPAAPSPKPPRASSESQRWMN